tara:strand:- start:84097 stop:86358 length:2262 start_codon:yes stop_codon:yes gene_type:complete
MKNIKISGGLRYRLMLEASLAVIGSFSLAAPPAVAGSCETKYASSNTVSNSISCAFWLSGGNLTIKSNGYIGPGEEKSALKVIAYVGRLYVDGTIYGDSRDGILVQENTFINQITNNKSIKSTSKNAINNNGTISQLSNTGTISSNEAAAINLSGGTLITLDNSGIIVGKHAIKADEESTIGSITNSGTISGKISNDANKGWTISGGNDDQSYGLFTGSSGETVASDVGQINHKNADLTFGSGYIWLNDNINLENSTLKVANATIKLTNKIKIIGDYAQTGGGLVSQVTSDNQYGALDVAGRANISNSTLVIQGSNLQAGDTYTIVGVDDNSGTIAFTSSSVVGTNGLTATASQDNGGNLVVTLASSGSSSGKYTPIGDATGGAASSLGSVLDKINGASTPEAKAFQTNVLAAIDSLPSNQRGVAIKELAPANGANTMQMASQSTSIVVSAIDARQQLAMSDDVKAYGTTGLAAGAATAQSALWGQFLGGSAHLSGSSENDGFSSKSFGLTSGFDHKITPDLMAGVALSWLRSWTDGSNAASGSSQRLDSFQLNFYGTYRMDRLTFDGQIGAGWNHFDQKRNVLFLGQTAKADYSGQQYLGRVRAGYDFVLGDTTTVTPFGGLRYIYARNESYDENGAGSANNAVDSQSSDSLTQELGARAMWQLDTDYGVLTPEISAAWVHDYTSNTQDASGVIGGQAYSIHTEGLPSDGVRLGLALALTSPGATDLRVEYNGELRSGYQSQTTTVKASWNF